MQLFTALVTNRKAARRHLDVAGRAHCGAGSGRTLGGTRRQVAGNINLAGVCKRCLPELRRRVAGMLETAALGERWFDMYAAADEALRTPAQIAAEADLLTGIADLLTSRWAAAA